MGELGFKLRYSGSNPRLFLLLSPLADVTIQRVWVIVSLSRLESMAVLFLFIFPLPSPCHPRVLFEPPGEIELVGGRPERMG